MSQVLLDAMNAAHAASALRGNLSHQALVLAAQGSRNYLQAMTAAMMTLGGAHAPIIETVILLRLPDPLAWVVARVDAGGKVPGWGNDFVKGQVDPLWVEVDGLLREHNPDLMVTVDAITALFAKIQKPIHPNPSCYTAAVAVTLGMPVEAAPYLFVSARLGKWTEEFCRVLGASR